MGNSKRIGVKKVLVTGSNGLIGSKFCELYGSDYQIVTADISNQANPVDITNEKDVTRIFESEKPEALIHFAAYTDVNGAWQQTNDKNGSAYQINVNGTRLIAQNCARFSTHLIHISTAYVFDGTKETEYLETDTLSPIEWYGKTKALAEEEVHASNCRSTIFRIDQPFRSDDFVKLDVVRKILSGIKNNSLYPQFIDHTFSPTYIDDFVKAIAWSVDTSNEGIFHCTTNTVVSDFSLANSICEAFNLQYEITPGNLNEYLKKVNRPYQKNTALNADLLYKASAIKFLNLMESLKMIQSSFLE